MSPFRLFLITCLLGSPLPALSDSFTLSIPSIKPNGWLSTDQVFNGFGCEGANRSPRLGWRNPPAGTKSFAITVYDPDAPTGSGWWHWVVINIPLTTYMLPESAGNSTLRLLPSAAKQVPTDFGQPGYGGACPPVGDKPHKYIFTVYALNTEKIDLPSNATAAFAGFMIKAHLIDKVSVTAIYGR